MLKYFLYNQLHRPVLDVTLDVVPHLKTVLSLRYLHEGTVCNLQTTVYYAGQVDTRVHLRISWKTTTRRHISMCDCRIRTRKTRGDTGDRFCRLQCRYIKPSYLTRSSSRRKEMKREESLKEILSYLKRYEKKEVRSLQKTFLNRE